jgi:hypothetical protein
MRMKGLHRNEGAEGGGGADSAAAAAAAAQTEQLNTAVSTLTEGKYSDVGSFQEFFKGFEENFVPKTELEKFNDYVPQDKRFANSFVQEINALVEKKVPEEQITMFVDLSLKDIEKMSSTDALVKKMVFENDISMADAKMLVHDKYPATLEEYMQKNRLDATDAEDLQKAEREYKLLTINANVEAKTAKSFLSEKKKSIFDGITTNQEMLQKHNQSLQERAANLKTAWQSNRDLNPTIESDLKNINVTVKDDKSGIDYAIDIPFSDEFKQVAAKRAAEIALEFNADATPEKTKEIIGLLKQEYILRNFNTITETLVRDAIAKATKERDLFHSNPNRTGGNGGGGGGGNGGGGNAAGGFYK